MHPGSQAVWLLVADGRARGVPSLCEPRPAYVMHLLNSVPKSTQDQIASRRSQAARVFVCARFRSKASLPFALTSSSGAWWYSEYSIAIMIQPAAVRCDMVLHQAFRARYVRNNGIGGEVRHGVTSGVSRETSLNRCVTPHLHREYILNVRQSRSDHRLAVSSPLRRVSALSLRGQTLKP